MTCTFTPTLTYIAYYENESGLADFMSSCHWNLYGTRISTIYVLNIQTKIQMNV